MANAKSVVRGLLKQLPEDCTISDIQYHLYVLKKIEDGLEDERQGKVTPHEQVAREMRRKWQFGNEK